MSLFYKKTKKEILEVYEYFGWGDKFINSLLILLIVTFCWTIYLSSINRITDENNFTVLILLAIVFIIYKILKWSENKSTKKRLHAIKIIKNRSDMNLLTCSTLIEEISKKIDKTRTFVTWIVGIFVTLLVLTVTISSNIIFKILDAFDNKEKKQIFEDIISSLNEMGVKNPETAIYNFIGNIMLNLCSIVFMAYLILSLFNLIKNEILMFLHDVRYELQKDEELKSRLKKRNIKLRMPPANR